MGSSQSSYATTNNNVVDSPSNNKKNRLLKNLSSTRGRKPSNKNNSNNISKSTTTGITTTIDKVSHSQHGLRSSVVSMIPSSASDENAYGSDDNFMLDTTSTESVHSDYQDDHHYHHDTNVDVVPNATKPTIVTWNQDHVVDDIEDEEDTEESSDEDVWDEEERRLILEDVRQLKFMAKAFLHPEIPMADTTSLWASGMECARCFYDRYSFATSASPKAIILRQTEESSDEDEDVWDEDEEERRRIMEDVRQLKFMAKAFLHPEIPMADTTSLWASGMECARCYYDRYSFATSASPQTEELSVLDEDEEERRLILEDVRQLKFMAKAFLHPEIPMADTTSLWASGMEGARCYYDRYSFATSASPTAIL